MKKVSSALIFLLHTIPQNLFFSEHAQAQVMYSRKLCENFPELSRSVIIGKWIVGASEISHPGHVTFSSNGVFILKGWKTPKFRSKGRWQLDTYNSRIQMRFTDNLAYWNGFGKGMLGKDLHIVEKDVDVSDPQTRHCNYKIDFFKYYFYRDADKEYS
jgi:hypothetical protein